MPNITIESGTVMESVHGVAQVFMTDKECHDTQEQCHCAEENNMW